MPTPPDDDDILIEFHLSDDPFLFAIELTDTFDMTRQGIHNRLVALEKQGFLNSKKPGRDRAYWLTSVGADRAESAFNDSRFP